MNQKIVFQGKTKKGFNIIIRYPIMEDLHAMFDYINTLSKEETFISYQGEEISLDEEKEFLEKQIKKINKNQAVLLLAFSNNALVGMSGIEMKERKYMAHEGVFGISVAAAHRNQGIGRLLMENVFAEAIKQLPQLKMVILGVFSNNVQAIMMYEKFSFTQSGKTPKGILHRGQYVDYIYMYKFVRDFN